MQQARALLERIAVLDPGAPLAERARQLERLRELPVQDPELVRARDTCATAHGGLLSAEAEQAAVRQRIEREGDGGFGPEDLADMKAALGQAGERLRAAQAALPECEAQTRKLVKLAR